jgi:hypothetical protein
MGIEFGVKKIKINNKILRIQTWDSTGQKF